MKTIQIRTEIPGPSPERCWPGGKRHSAGAVLVTPIFAAKAEGAWIEDVDGNRYIDFAAASAA